MENEKPDSREDTGRNPDGTWKKGFCPNRGGRTKNPLKEFSLKEFNSWTDEQKKDFLLKIDPIDRWRMTEGNPSQDNKTDSTIRVIMATEDETIEGTDTDTEGQPQI